MVEDIIDQLCNIAKNVKKQQFELLAKKYSESDLFNYDEENKEADFFINPFRDFGTWHILNALKYIDDLVSIDVEFAENKDEDYDTIKVRWN